MNIDWCRVARLNSEYVAGAIDHREYLDRFFEIQAEALCASKAPTVDDCPMPELLEESVVWGTKARGYKGPITGNVTVAYQDREAAEESRRFWGPFKEPFCLTLQAALERAKGDGSERLIVADGDDNILFSYPVWTDPRGEK